MEKYVEIANFIRDDLRLKGFPIAVKYLKNREEFPEKTKQPAIALKKRITICQAVTMARIYGWTVGLTKEDLICVPAMIAFGMASPDKVEEMSKAIEQLPLRRVGEPEKDIGPVAVFLACEDSDFITGQTLMVDGGAHMF